MRPMQAGFHSRSVAGHGSRPPQLAASFIEPTSVVGTFETCRPAVTMSAPEGRPEVMGRPANAYLGVFLGVRLIYQCDIITQHGGRPMTVLVAPPQTISFSRECR